MGGCLGGSAKEQPEGPNKNAQVVPAADAENKDDTAEKNKDSGEAEKQNSDPRKTENPGINIKNVDEDEDDGSDGWKKHPDSCLAELYPRSTGYLCFTSLSNAKEKANTLNDCGGITLVAGGLYELRLGKRPPKPSSKGETTWLKPRNASSANNNGLAGGAKDGAGKVDEDGWKYLPNVYLPEHPISAGETYEYETLEEAKRAAKLLDDCAGITQNVDTKKFELRGLPVPRRSHLGENSWLRPPTNFEGDDGGFQEEEQVLDDGDSSGAEDKSSSSAASGSSSSSSSGSSSGSSSSGSSKKSGSSSGGSSAKKSNAETSRPESPESHDEKDVTSPDITGEETSPNINRDSSPSPTHSAKAGEKKKKESKISRKSSPKSEKKDNKSKGKKKMKEEEEREQQEKLRDEQERKERERVAKKQKQQKEKREKQKTENPEALQVQIDYSNVKGVYRKIPDREKHNDRCIWKHETVKLYLAHTGQNWVISWMEFPKDEAFNRIAVTKSCPDSQSPLAENGTWLDGLNVKIYDKVKWDGPNEPEEGKFTDPDFPPEQSSLGTERFAQVVEWRRACNINRAEEMELYCTFEPTDVQQGQLGDCWLLAAFAAMAEYPGYLADQIFQQDELTADSKYSFRLFDCLKNEWATVTIDDWIPCDKRTGDPLFAQTCGNEVWVMLLEKAFAKVYGSYQALSGGQPSYGWSRLTGVTRCERWKWADPVAERSKLRGIYLSYENTTKISGGWWCMRPKTNKATEEFWKFLREADKKNYVMGANIVPAPDKSIEHKREDGLVEGHAYSLLSLFELEIPDTAAGENDPENEDTKKDTKTIRLVQLRNPWGKFEWSGKWSDGDDETWDSIDPTVLEKAGIERVEDEDGAFFMSWEDFLRIWDGIGICPCASLGLKRHAGLVKKGEQGRLEVVD